MESGTIRERSWQGWRAFEVASPELRAVLVPELGGKLVSLSDGRREWLWQNPRRPLRRPLYGAAYDRYDMSGFDECFPTILPCRYPAEPWQDRELPDHGELWTLPWRVLATREQAGLVLEALGRALPYRFWRGTAVRGNRLLLSYRVENLGLSPLLVAWWAHPILQVEPEMTLEAPAVTSVVATVSRDGALPEGEELPWPAAPLAGGGEWRLDRVGSPRDRRAVKLYSQRLPEHETAQVTLRAADGASLTFIFSTGALPYLGLWLNYGAFPAVEPQFNVGVEPAMVRGDALDPEALQGGGGHLPQIPPGGALRWSLALEVTAAD